MGMGKSIGKLDDYYERLSRNKAGEIKPSHIEKVLAKLQDKQSRLESEIAATEKTSKKERLEVKLSVLREQIRRGEWLMREISAGDTPD